MNSITAFACGVGTRPAPLCFYDTRVKAMRRQRQILRHDHGRTRKWRDQRSADDAVEEMLEDWMVASGGASVPS